MSSLPTSLLKQLETRRGRPFAFAELPADKTVFTRSYFHLPLWGTLLAEGALIQIGNEALGPLEENLATSDDPQVQKLSLDAIQRIENDPDVARAELRRAIAHEPNATRRHRLEVALREIGRQKPIIG